MPKELQEFVDGLKSATEKFNLAEAQVASMKQKIDEMSQEIVRLNSTEAAKGVESKELGFESTAQAKQFITFVRDVANNRVKDLVTTVNESTQSEGGYLVPVEFIPTLAKMLEVYGFGRQYCTVIPMKGESLKFPKLTGGLQTYWIGEGQTIPKTAPTFGEVNMTAKKMALMVPLTSEILEDSSIEIANLIATLIAQAIAKEEDRVILVGKALNAPWDSVMWDASVPNVSLPATKTAISDLNADVIADLIASMTPLQSENARFMCHRTVFNVLRKLKTTTGEYIYNAPTEANAPGTIWGYPITINETMPNISASAADVPFLFFGNPKHIYLGDRRKMTVAQSPHVGFAEDKLFVRVTERIGYTIAMPEALRVLRTAAV